MPKKGKKGKKKGGKKKGKAPANADQIIQRLLKCYERNCVLTESRMCPKIASSLRGCIENSSILTQVNISFCTSLSMVETRKKYIADFKMLTRPAS